LTGVDIAVYGIPWSSLSYPWGDGTKFAPGVLREMTCRSAYPVLPHWPYHFNVNEVCKIVDYGDVEYGSNIHYMDVMLENLEATTKAVLDAGATPLIIAGDHSTTLGPMRAEGKKYDGKLGVIHLDAHPNSRLGSPRLQAWGGKADQPDEGGLDDQLLP
jgi:agmatinase